MHKLLQVPLLMTLIASPTLHELSACNANIDDDEDGYTSDVDCDDTDPSIHPDAAELPYDGIDQDCSGADLTDVDGDGFNGGPAGDDCNDTDASVYPDATEIPNDGIDQDCSEADKLDLDGDGYRAGVDCNDTNASAYPGAPDVAGDGVDMSCDGSDGLAPSVGLPTSSFTTIQAALDAAASGQTVWVGPGTYLEHSLHIDTHHIRLQGTAGADLTIVDAQGLGRLLTLAGTYTSKLEAITLQGLTLQNGWVDGESGAGLLIKNAELTLQEVVLQGHVAALHCTTTESGPYTSSSSETTCTTTEGGAIAAENASLHLEQVLLDSNGAWSGAGILLRRSTLSGSDVTFHKNISLLSSTGSSSGDYEDYNIYSSKTYGIGGAILTENSTLALERSTFSQNSANQGGGIAAHKSTLTLTDVSFQQHQTPLNKDEHRSNYGDNQYYYNFTPGRGGAIDLEDSALVLQNGLFEDNHAVLGGALSVLNSSLEAVGGRLLKNGEFSSVCSESKDGVTTCVSAKGGGILAQDAQLKLSNLAFHQNYSGSGGGSFLQDSTGQLEAVSLIENEAGGFGGGLYLVGSSPALDHLTLAGNSAGQGGGLYLESASPTLKNSILAYNQPLNLYADVESTPSLSYTNVYQAYGASHNLVSVPASVTTLEPGFVAYSYDGDASNDDLHLKPTSPLINAGDASTCTSSDPSGCDPDGSLPDLGAFGGAKADGSYYEDSDQDGLYDGWELAQVDNLTTLAGQQDADADGLTNAQELQLGTSPDVKDSDGDGALDGAEVAQSKDPLNPCSVPGMSGLMALAVPSSGYPTVQSALNAIPTGKEGAVTLAAGTFNENLTLYQKSVTVQGAGQSQTVLDGQDRDHVWKAMHAWLKLSDVTIQNGLSQTGGGMHLEETGGALENLTVQSNDAYPVPSAYDVDTSGSVSGQGGGMYLKHSAPSLRHVTFKGNSASSRNPYVWSATLSSRSYGQGGGMYLVAASPLLEHVRFDGNQVLGLDTDSMDNDYGNGSGAGMYLKDASPTLRHVSVTNNLADGGYGDGYGGGIYMQGGSPVLEHVSITGNRAEGDSYGAGIGGGMYLVSTSPTLVQVSVTGNSASGQYSWGGGIYMDSSTLSFENSILAYNRADRLAANLYEETYDATPSTFSAHNALIYNPSGWMADNLTPVGTYLTVEPKFLRYADSNGASCSPGTSLTCLPSNLHPALGSPLINAGDPAEMDVDGSIADIGVFGGEGGDEWDVDMDGVPDYFWPGEWSNAPVGFNAEDYDRDDVNAAVQ